MRYGKLINNYIRYAGDTENGICNPTEKQLKEMGFKPVIEQSAETGEMQKIETSYKETDDSIVIQRKAVDYTAEEKVAYLESKYNMPRVIRELILAAGSDYNKAKAEEIEQLAKQLRG